MERPTKMVKYHTLDDVPLALIIVHVLPQLSTRALGRLMCTCKRFRTCVPDDHWRDRMVQELQICPPDTDVLRWKNCYELTRRDKETGFIFTTYLPLILGMYNRLAFEWNDALVLFRGTDIILVSATETRFNTFITVYDDVPQLDQYIIDAVVRLSMKALVIMDMNKELYDAEKRYLLDRMLMQNNLVN